MIIKNIKFESDSIKDKFEECSMDNLSRLKKVLNILEIIDSNLKKYEISIYEVNEDNNYKFYCSNIEDKIVIFSLSHSEKLEDDIIEVHNNDKSTFYNLSILPKLKLDEEKEMFELLKREEKENGI